MHISEGVLSGPVLVSGAALAAIGTAIGLKKLDYDHIAQAGILSSTFFVASLIHVPIGPSSVHLILNGIIGILLGWAAFPAIMVALALQAVFFQFGGITVLGVNTVIMALPAVVSYYLFRPMIKKDSVQAGIAAFCCGFFSVFMSAILAAGALFTTNQGFLKLAVTIAGAHVPVMIIEGIVTAFCLSFLRKVQPEMLMAPEKAKSGHGLTIAVIASIAMILSAKPALAHKVTIFAWAEGNTIHTVSKFSDGTKVRKGRVSVFNPKDKLLLTGTTNDKGEFRFNAKKQEPLKIVLDASMGHRAVWNLTMDDFTPLTDTKTKEETADFPIGISQAKTREAAPGKLCSLEIRRAVEQAIDKKLDPLMKMVADLHDPGPSMNDVFGGLGYIIGLVGIGAYFKGGNRKDNK